MLQSRFLRAVRDSDGVEGAVAAVELLQETLKKVNSLRDIRSQAVDAVMRGGWKDTGSKTDTISRLQRDHYIRVVDAYDNAVETLRQGVSAVTPTSPEVLRIIKAELNDLYKWTAENRQFTRDAVAKMEAADDSVSIDLLVRSLLKLGVLNPEIGRTISSRP